MRPLGYTLLRQILAELLFWLKYLGKLRESFISKVKVQMLGGMMMHGTALRSRQATSFVLMQPSHDFSVQRRTWQIATHPQRFTMGTHETKP